MKLKHIKVTLFFSILLCCIFLILGFSITIEKTSAEQYSLLTLTQEDLSFQTDRDIDEFEFKTGFIEGTSVYYEVQDPEDKQYSLRPQIKTKFLNYGNCDFLITFSYFTRQIESLAHEVYVYACAYNDKDLIGSIKCFDNGLDNNTYDVGQLEYAGAFEYLIFELRVYKSTVLQNSGLYFRTDNIKIQAVSNYELESDDFEYEITEDTYYYTGEVISLAHDVTTNVDQDKYFVDIFCDREIKNIGSYQVTMSILDTAHVTVSNKVKTINVVANPIDLISVNVIRNEDFAIILDATFEDTYGYTYPLKDIDIKRIYPLNGTNTIDIKFNTTNFIKQNEDADFSASYTIRLETFDSYEAKGIYIDSINISKTYDGTIFDMNSYIKGFTEYNEDTNEITEVAAPSFAIEYFNGTEQINEIINVGEYTYSFSYGTQTILGEISILPIEIHRGNYTGTSSFDKTYDGTNIVPIDGMLGSTINPNDIELSNLLVSADVSLDAKKLEFFRTIGKTAIKVTEGELVGEDSGNYILASDFYLTNYGYISQARLAYVSNTDTAGNLMKFNEKYFNGDYDIEINYDEDVCLTLSGLGEEEVKYSQIEATLLDVNVGIVDVELTIIDYTLLGFFEEKIYMQIYPQVEILPYKLLIDNAIVSNETKTYDGTTDTNLVIESCSFSNLKDFGDGLSDILENNSKYDYVYNQAQYQTSEAGTVRINISGIIFKGFERDIQKVFNNYIIDNFVVDGHINKAPLKVEAEVIRILEGGAVSNLKLSVEGNDLVTYSIHTTKDDAINDVNYIDEANIPIGDYYLRVVCNSTNYTFIGTDYVLVQLIVKAPQEKTNQHIVINSFVYEKNITKIVIMKGGQVDLHAYSIYGSSGESDKKTNLPLTYEYSNGGSSICIVENDVLKGLNIGSAKIYISQPGDIYYNAADTIELNVEVREYSVASTINTIGDLYIPDKLPQDLSFYLLTSKINSNNVSSNIESIPDEAIKLGENDYNFLINFDENIYHYILINEEDLEEMFNSRIIYEITGDIYAITEDTTPQAGKDYYVVSFIEVYGKKEIGITLNGVKRNLTIYFNNTYNINYKDNFDFISGIEKITINDVNVLIDDYVNVVSENDYLLKRYSSENESLENANKNELLPGTYTISTSNIYSNGNLYVVLRDNLETIYNISLDGSLTLEIEKGEVNISINTIVKDYYAPLLTDYSHLLTIIGNIDTNEEINAIKENINILLGIDVETGAGTYPVELEIDNASLSQDILDKYTFIINNGFVVINPLIINVRVINKQSKYSKAIQNLEYRIDITNRGLFTEEKINEIEKYVKDSIVIGCELNENSAVGEYPITLYYSGEITDYNIVITNGVYLLEAADFEGFFFNDEIIKYDGLRHNIEVTYVKAQWPEAIVSYDFDYFVEPGKYIITASISQDNYRTLQLRATLTIGVDNFETTTQTMGSVKLIITDENCTRGIDPEITIYSGIQTEGTQNFYDLISKNIEYEDFEVLNYYYVTFLADGVDTEISYKSYKLTFTPADIKKTDTLLIYGYDVEGNYGKLTYEYTDGKYTINVSNLNGIAFVEKTTKRSRTIVTWVIVAIVIVIGLILVGFFFSSSRIRKQKIRSRKRHNRWA